MRNREALEEAVYDAYPSLDMFDIERMETDKLEWLMEIRQGRRKDPATMTPSKLGRPAKKPSGVVWTKVSARHEVRDDVLVHVELWRASSAAEEAVREHVTVCGDRVRYEGRLVSSSRLKHYLQTGQWVSRVPRAKPAPRFKAQIRLGRRVVHIGYFATQEERDAAVFAYRLGIAPAGSK